MSDATLQTRSDFDRLAALDQSEWDHNVHYHAFLLRFLPLRRDAALDVGCGTGAFSRALADRFRSVAAVDLSPGMIERAMASSHAHPNIGFEHADFNSWRLPPRSFDCVASIATLHHLPFEQSLARFRDALRPAGVLLVLDLYEPRTFADWIWTSVAVPADVVVRAWKLGRLRDDPAVRQAWAEHARHDTYPQLDTIHSIANRLMPGVRIRRHLFWRYSLIWQKPD